MIYFDSAATSWPKPQEVMREVELTMRYRGGNPSRAGHPLSAVAGKVIYRCREKLAEHFGTEPERVLFFPGATYAINTAMKSVIPPGSHFLISDMEHNAVVRPAFALQEEGSHFDTFDAMATTEEMLAEIGKKIRRNTVALVCLHGSNVAPHILPVAQIGALCQKQGLLFILDAAQTGGHVPIDTAQMGIDALCMPGHKGLLGPQGCGCMILSSRMQACMEQGRTIIEGGSGIRSDEVTMPPAVPERFEPGTQPTPMLAGLCAGVRTIEKIGYAEIAAREQAVYRILREGMLNMPGIKLYLPEREEGNILLFNIEGAATEAVGAWFDKEGICLRSGFHCAPSAHHKLNTGSGGAIRISIGWHNTAKEALAFLSALWRARREFA